jgi:PD-(D/E)XK nuclease superfamily
MIYGAEAVGADDLIRTFTARQQLSSAQRAERQPVDAPLFSPLDFCRTDEIGLSRLICWMLDPRGSHAQGASFLRCFFTAFGIDDGRRGELERACARPEVITHAINASQRRIDIVVTCPGFTLAIENKPYASFQLDQIPDYDAHLRKTAADAYALVILKGRAGHAPPAQIEGRGVARERIIDSDYDRLAAWVADCADLCIAPSVSKFLRQFHAHLVNEFGTGRDMLKESDLLDVLDTTERELAALDFVTAAEGLYAKLHSEFATSLQSAAGNRWRVTTDASQRAGRHTTDKYHLTVDFGAELPAVFAFDLWSYSPDALISVRTRAGARNVARRSKAICKDLNTSFPASGRPSETWLWWGHHSDLVDAGRLSSFDANAWKTLVHPAAATAALAALVNEFETVIRRAVDL